ncbi:MAG: hypothetical protein HYR94_27260 [Chloroflexi bacterium]|nr:hypothetical protein [Chloroflexota bacterium]
MGVIWGLVWVMVEWTLWTWAQRDGQVQNLYVLTNLIILILTSTIFVYSPNLWLLWPIHGGLVAIANFRPRGRMVSPDTLT